MKKSFLSLVFLIIASWLAAQHYVDYSIEVKKSNGTDFLFPWAGGLNNPQFSSVDLNNDGTDDLFIFDRTGNHVCTFLNNGAAGTVDYIYAPQFESHFPSLNNWALLIDYNCDGIADIYTYTGIPATGIKVFRGYYDSQNEIQFTLARQLLEFPVLGDPVNIYCSAVDIPAITDVNSDGDMDILTFKITGTYMEYYENLSQESGFGCDSFIFKKEDDCWGDFTESGLQRADDLNQPCPFFIEEIERSEGSEELRHSGSTTVAFDNDGDMDKEIITGDISWSNLVYLHNGGTLLDAHITSQDTLFPSTDLSADVYVFPATFLVDVNNDELLDMIVSPNAEGASQNYHVAWYYRNLGTTTTADFNFVKDTFLIEDMIDMGELAYPVFFDADADGLKDLLVGNRGYFDEGGVFIGQISFYRNTGTAAEPAFQLITKDYANLAQLAQKNMSPTFGDLDNDGDADMITGLEDGTLLYFNNTAGAGNPANFVFTTAVYQGIDVGNFSTPQLVDANRDGKLDLLIGERDGILNYFENTGTVSVPVFTTDSLLFGDVDVRQQGYQTGYSVPFLVDLETGVNDYTLFVGSERGFIFQYGSIDGNLNGTFTKIDSTYSDVFEGSRSTVTASDMNGNGKAELAVGNYRGGLKYFSDSPVGIEEVDNTEMNFTLSPNPSNGSIQLLFSTSEKMEYRISVINLLGQEIYSSKILSGSQTFNLHLSDRPSGMYLVVVSSRNESQNRKLILQ